MVTILVIRRTQLDFKTSFLHLIYSLCVCDSVCIVFNIIIFSFPLLSETYRHQVLPHLIPLMLPLAQISLTSSVYTILALAMERFMAVSW